MTLGYKIIPIIIAGLANGSFVVPTRYIKNLTNEKIWIFHSIIGMIIIPWTIFFIPNITPTYSHLNTESWLLLIFGGFFFGLGQICFSYSIDFIGMALAFSINLGLGATVGSIFVLLYKKLFFTLSGGLVVSAVGMIILGLILNYFSSQNMPVQHFQYKRGWFLAFLAGLASGLQNIVFIILTTQSPQLNSFWVWPPFLLIAAVCMIVGFLIRIKKSPSQQFNINISFKNILLLILMGILFAGSLKIYSSSMSNLPSHLQIIGWPTLMVSIILASQFWGLYYKESRYSLMKNKVYKSMGIVLLLLAVILIAFAI